MAKKKRGDAHGGGHGWFVTFADLMGLMMSFFVMLVAFSTMDNNKLKIVAGSMRDAFGTQTASALLRHRRIRRPADPAEAEERGARCRPRKPPIRRRRTSRNATVPRAPG